MSSSTFGATQGAPRGGHGLSSPLCHTFYIKHFAVTVSSQRLNCIVGIMNIIYIFTMDNLSIVQNLSFI